MLEVGRASPGESEQFLQDLLPQLSSLPSEEVISPFVDPAAVAMRALSAVAVLRAPKWAPQMEALVRSGLFDPSPVEPLRRTAHALLYLRAPLGESWVPHRESPSVDVFMERSASLRQVMVTEVDVRLAAADETRLWLDVVRQSHGPVDMLCDLRILTHIYRVNEGALASGSQGSQPRGPHALGQAKRCADALEGALLGEEPTSASEARRLVARAFTLLVPGYEAVCRVGRFVEESRPSAFPELASISRALRARPIPETAAST